MIDKFLEFLIRVNQDFPTPLSDRVNLRKYAKKLVDNGFVVSTIKENKIVGIVVIYCNDFDTYNAYIPLVAVDKNYRGQKISKALMLCAMSYAKGLGFKRIGIHTENPIALNLYNSLGFKMKDDVTQRKYLELEM